MKRILLLSASAVILLSSFATETPYLGSNETTKTAPIQAEYVSISGPKLLAPNSIVKIAVEYKASSRRDIQVFLQSTKTWDQPISKSKTVNAGSGTVYVEFKIPRLPNSVNGHRWGAYIKPVGGGYKDRIGEEVFIYDVDIKRVKKKKKKKKKKD